MIKGENREAIQDNSEWADSWAEVARLANEEDEACDFELYAQIERVCYREVFADVDHDMIEQVTNTALEKIDGKELLDFVGEIDGDIENGVEAVEEYFAEVLGLEKRPILREMKIADSTIANFALDGDTPVIIYDLAKIKRKSVNELITTLGHENWHAFQHQEAMRENGERKVPLERATCYVYNLMNYIDGKIDYYGYRNQLIEAEAFTFEEGIKTKMEAAKIDYETASLIDEYPDVYSDKNMLGIEQEMQRVFGEFDVKTFLNKIEMRTVEEFFDNISQNDDKDKTELLAQKYVEFLEELVDLQYHIAVEMVDDLERVAFEKTVSEDEYFDEDDTTFCSHMIRFGQNFYLDGKRKDLYDTFMVDIPRLVWELHQNEVMENAPDSDLAELYSINRINFVKEEEDYELANNQLLIRERNEFVLRWNGVLSEQVGEEE